MRLYCLYVRKNFSCAQPNRAFGHDIFFWQAINVEQRLDIRKASQSESEEAEVPEVPEVVAGDDELREYQRPFDIAKLTSRRNDDVYSKLHWIVESDYFQALIDRKPRNDDPEVIDIIR